MTHNYYPEFTNRMKFLTEPNQGDASITISGLKVSDTGTYQCKVKKAPGVDMRKVTLVVLGKEELLLFFFFSFLYRFYLFIISLFVAVIHLECPSFYYTQGFVLAVGVGVHFSKPPKWIQGITLNMFLHHNYKLQCVWGFCAITNTKLWLQVGVFPTFAV